MNASSYKLFEPGVIAKSIQTIVGRGEVIYTLIRISHYYEFMTWQDIGTDHHDVPATIPISAFGTGLTQEPPRQFCCHVHFAFMVFVLYGYRTLKAEHVLFFVEMKCMEHIQGLPPLQS